MGKQSIEWLVFTSPVDQWYVQYSPPWSLSSELLITEKKTLKVTTPLLKKLDQLLQKEIADLSRRQTLIKDLLNQFKTKSTLIYSLSDNTSIILLKDESKLNRLRRYVDSPFPYLSNIEFFSSSVGDWDSELKQYGIKTRNKGKIPCSLASLGTQIYLIRHQSVLSQGNHYLKRQYRRLELYRTRGEITKYWKLCWTLMQKSSVYRLASLNSWKPRWYKTLSLSELSTLWKNLHCILSLSTQQTTIKNVWIESPKGKWRQLGIPPKVWRLYLHMLNMFISYIYSPHLESSIYDGFLYQRGCKSWWETVLWGPLLEQYKWILEVDLSSGFPNLSLHSVRKALQHDGLIPLNIIDLILTHLRSPLLESLSFPTYESYLENRLNKEWRKGSRSVHMGLGISPILFVITQRWALNQIELLKIRPSVFTYKWYADDGSFYFNLSWLYLYYKQSKKSLYYNIKVLLQNQNPILTYLNDHPLLKEVGIKFCLQKSSLVRIEGIWKKRYKSLGLSLTTPLSYYEQFLHLLQGKKVPLSLQAETRGRGANPVLGRPSTSSSTTVLSYWNKSRSSELNLQKMILSYRPYFGLLMSKLYSPSELSSPIKAPQSVTPRSLQWELQRSKANKYLAPRERLDLYNTGSKLTKLVLNLMNKETNDLTVLIPNLKRSFRYEWPSLNVDILQTKIANPLANEPVRLTDHFIKYSEFRMNTAEEEQYRKDYKQVRSL